MEYILGLIILIMIFLGYRVMKKIDDFLELPTTFPKEKKYVDYGGVILVYGKSVKNGVNLGTRKTFSDIGKTIGEMLSVKNDISGESFAKDILL